MNILKTFSILLLFVCMHAFSMDQPYSIILEGSNCSFKKIEDGIFTSGSCIIGMNNHDNWLIGIWESKQTFVVGFFQETQGLLRKLYENKNCNTFDYMMTIKGIHFSVRQIVDLNSEPKIIK